MTAIHQYETIRTRIVARLEGQLPADLYYHCLEHTLDAVNQAERIALAESIDNPEDLFLLKTACLYHDTGFMFTYKGHEAESCEIAREELPAYGLTEVELDRICELIMSTRIPHAPPNKLAEIICDADLDYLGREDFFTISDSLYRELIARNMISNLREWNEIQVKFLSQHHYFTATSIALRGPVKEKHLLQIKGML